MTERREVRNRFGRCLLEEVPKLKGVRRVRGRFCNAEGVKEVCLASSRVDQKVSGNENPRGIDLVLCRLRE